MKSPVGGEIARCAVKSLRVKSLFGRREREKNKRNRLTAKKGEKKMKLVYKIAEAGSHIFISVDGRLVSVSSKAGMEQAARGDGKEFFSKYGIFPSMFFAAQKEAADKSDFSAELLGFRAFCRKRKGEDGECARASEGCLLYNICHGEGTFWDRADEIAIEK